MKRTDGRKFDEARPIEMKVGVIKNAQGSALFKIGNTHVIAGVYGPRDLFPKFLQNPKKAMLRCTYDMSSFSVSDRKKPGPSRRSQELSMVITNSLAPAVFLEEYPRTVIDVFIEVTQADAGTRCAAICAASLALADAGIPMRGLVSAISAGNIGKDVVLDLTSEEEHLENVSDIPVAYLDKDELITLIQMDGEIDQKQIKEAVSLAVKGCKKITEMQKKTLLAKYKFNSKEGDSQ